jgi:hypothetical protein
MLYERPANRRAKQLGTEQSYGRPSSDVLELNTLYEHVDAFQLGLDQGLAS